MNSYYMVKDVRDNVVESTAKHWGDDDILRKLNASYRARVTELSMVPGDWLTKSADLTPVASVVTLPDDCMKPIYMEHKADGYPIPFDITVRERQLSRQSTLLLGGYGGLNAYFVGQTIVVNKSAFTDQVTLWYAQRAPALVMGTGDTGTTGTTVIIPATSEPSLVDDTYNGATLEIVSGTDVGRSTAITDYDGGTRALTLTAGSANTTSVFGTVCLLPEEGHNLIVLEATLTCLAKPGVRMDPKYFQYFQMLYRDARRSWDQYIATRTIGSMPTRVVEEAY